MHQCNKPKSLHYKLLLLFCYKKLVSTDDQYMYYFYQISYPGLMILALLE